MKLYKCLLIFLIVLQATLTIKVKNSNTQDPMQGDAALATTQVTTQSTMSVGTGFEQLWAKLFKNGSKRPGHMCDTPLNIKFKVVKTNSLIDGGKESLLPAAKPNVFYNKPGYEDAAYLFDYLDEVIQQKGVVALEKIWMSSKAQSPDPKVKDPYTAKDQLAYYYLHGGANKIPFDPVKETDAAKVGKALRSFNTNVDPTLMFGGITIPQIGSIYSSFKMNFNPSLIGWQKKKLDQYDFNGDGTLSAEEFLFMVIWENKSRLHHKELFKEFCEQIIDPMFEYFDCDSDGYVSAEGIWSGLKELIRPNHHEYNMYKCLHPKTKQHVRTASVDDFILKNSEEREAYLNKDEFRKGILLGLWDRQVSNNLILKDDSNNQKDLRWVRREKDRKCEDGNNIR